jgi:hypothetical protein
MQTHPMSHLLKRRDLAPLVIRRSDLEVGLLRPGQIRFKTGIIYLPEAILDLLSDGWKKEKNFAGGDKDKHTWIYLA